MSNDLTVTALKALTKLGVRSGNTNAFIGNARNAKTPSSTERPLAAEESSLTGHKQTASSHVIKVAVKDNIVTSHSTTTCASGFLKSYISPYEASVAERLRISSIEQPSKWRRQDLFHGNYAISRKTNMDEFGMGSHSTHSYFGPVHNRIPWHDRSAGGSSGGSAIAVAEGICGIALGTDTGGSVRLPAAYTGLLGFKPSYGRISRWGVIPYANSLDTVGILVQRFSKALGARYLSPLHKCLKRLDAHDPRDPTSLTTGSRKRVSARNRKFAYESGRWGRNELKALRIGVPIEYNIAELDRSIRDTWKGVLEALRRQGHKIIPISLPSTKQALSAYYVLAAAEAASNLAKYDGIRYGTRDDGSDGAGGVLYANTRGNGFGDEVKRRILLGSYSLSSEAIDNYFIQAQKVRRLVQRDFDRVFAMPNALRQEEQFDLSDLEEDVELESKLGPAQVDVLVCPTAPTLPPLLKSVEAQESIDAYMNDVFTVPASLAGLPAISVPVRISHKERTQDNVPFAGIQVIGQYWDDFHIIDVGRMVQDLPRPRSPLVQRPPRKRAEPISRPLSFPDPTVQ